MTFLNLSFRATLLCMMAFSLQTSLEAQCPNNSQYAWEWPSHNNWFFAAGNQWTGQTYNWTTNTLTTHGTVGVNQVAQYEGVAAASDDQGNLLFFTNGRKLWDKNGVLKYSGLLEGNEAGLTGNNGSAVQGVIIVKHPLDPSNYYIFTTDDAQGQGVTNGFNYAVFNSASNVVTAPTRLGTYRTAEGIAATKHSNGVDIWISVLSAANPASVYTYLLTCTGLVSTPIVYNPTTTLNTTTGGGQGERGGLSFSSNGQYFASAFAVGGGRDVCAYKFNNATGAISDQQVLTAPATLDNPYDVLFSPDGSKVYISTQNGSLIYYDISSWTQPTMTNSRTSTGIATTFQAIEIGPDGNLYMGCGPFGGNPIQKYTGNVNAGGPFVASIIPGSVGYSGLPTMYLPPTDEPDISEVGPLCNSDAPVDLATNWYCAGSSAEGGTPAGTYTADCGACITNATSGTFDPGIAGVGTWQIIFTRCGVDDTINIQVDNCASCPDTALANSIPSICPSETISLNTYKLTAEAGTWSIEGGPVGHSATITGSTFNGNNSIAGSYVVRFTLTTPKVGCSSFAERTILIKPLPVVSVADHTQCFGQAAHTFDAGAGFNLYSWVGPGLITGSSQTLSASTAGAYTVTVTLNGCTASDNAVLTITPLPVVTLNLSKDEACINESSFALAGGSPSGGTYTGPGVSAGNFNPAAAGVGAKTITYQVTASGCTDSASSTLTVHDLPVVTLNIPTATICIDAASIVLSGGNPTPGTYSGSGVSGGSFNPSVAGAGKHTITYSHTDAFTCTNTAADTIRVNPLPQVSLAIPSPNVCEDLAPFNVTGGSPLGGTYSASSGMLAPPLFNPSLAASPATITYTYTDPSTTCTNNSNATLTVDTLPVLTLADSAVCPGGFIVLQPSPSTFDFYEWSTGVSGVNKDTIHYSIPNSTVWVKVTNAKGCSDTAFANITMDDTLHVDFGGPKEVCADQSIVLNAAQYGPFASPNYTWYPSGANQATLTVTASGLYGVLVMDNRGCIGGDTVDITIRPLPVLNINDSSACFIGKDVINVFVPAGFKTYNWSDGSVVNNIAVSKAGEVKVTVTNSFDCAASDSAMFTDFCEPTELCFPNVVTPNGDGNNDEFIPCKDDKILINDGNYKSIVNNILHIDLQVYDRWGVCVFHSLNTLPRWDCTYQGNRVASAVYYYVVRYTDSAHNNYEQTGWVQVLAE